MKVTIDLFAAARDAAGTSQVELQLPDPSTAADVRLALIAGCPSLEPIAAHLLLAVNDEYATATTPIHEGARVACFPPVSGG